MHALRRIVAIGKSWKIDLLYANDREAMSFNHICVDVRVLCGILGWSRKIQRGFPPLVVLTRRGDRCVCHNDNFAHCFIISIVT